MNIFNMLFACSIFPKSCMQTIPKIPSCVNTFVHHCIRNVFGSRSIMNRRHDKLLPLEFAKSTNLFLTFSKFVSVHHLAGGTLRNAQPCF